MTCNGMFPTFSSIWLPMLGNTQPPLQPGSQKTSGSDSCSVSSKVASHKHKMIHRATSLCSRIQLEASLIILSCATSRDMGKWNTFKMIFHIYLIVQYLHMINLISSSISIADFGSQPRCGKCIVKS